MNKKNVLIGLLIIIVIIMAVVLVTRQSAKTNQPATEKKEANTDSLIEQQKLVTENYDLSINLINFEEDVNEQKALYIEGTITNKSDKEIYIDEIWMQIVQVTEGEYKTPLYRSTLNPHDEKKEKQIELLHRLEEPVKPDETAEFAYVFVSPPNIVVNFSMIDLDGKTFFSEEFQID